MSKIITASCIIAVSASHVAPVGSAGGLVLAPTGGPAVVGLGDSRRLIGFQGHSGGIYSQCDANNPCNSPYVCDDRFKICSPYPNHPTAAQSAAAIAENNKLALARLRLSFAERKLKYNGNKAPRKQLARKLGNGKAPRKQLARKLSAIRNGEPMRALFGVLNIVAAAITKKLGENCGGVAWVMGHCGDGLSCHTTNHVCVENALEGQSCKDGVDCAGGLNKSARLNGCICN